MKNKLKKITIILFLISYLLPQKESDKIEQKIKNKNKNLNDLKEEIKSVEKELESNNKKKKTDKNDINKINTEIKKIEKTINELKKQKKKTIENIKKIENEISGKEKKLIELKEKLEKSSNYLYKHAKNKTYLSKIISTNSIEHTINIKKYFEILIENNNQIKNEINKTIKNLESKKEKLNEEKKKQKKSTNDIKKRISELEKKKKNKEKSIKKIEKESSTLKDQIKTKKMLILNMQKQIQNLISDKEAAKKLEQELAKRRSQKNKSTSGNFAKMKGKLNWPTDNGIVIEKFGMHTNSELHTQIPNIGIEIKANKNSPIYPVLDGSIYSITYNREYGNIVMVSHGDGYYTVYTNIDNISVNQNDYIETDNKIGEVSKSKITEQYSFNFQIYKNKENLNPEIWLKKK